ncbi:MAG: hypothetical protein DHS20C18_20550 [Saprospiraceae bacterium]|nr:MAG: hypothetical protein DHS20C18_20550 [Saprospiraceae bacterium]
MTSKIMTFLSIAVLFLTVSISAIAQESASAADLYNSGLEKLKAKQYAEAMPLMEQAIAAADATSETDQKVVKLAQRNGAVAAYYLGNRQRKADKVDEALATYQKGIEWNASFYANYIGQAQALDDKGEIAKAVPAYLHAAEMCSKKEKTKGKVASLESKASNILALAYSDKKYAEAIAASEAYLEVKDAAEAHYYLAKALLDTGKATDALTHADQAITMIPEGEDPSKYHMAKGEVHEALKQSDSAVEAYKKVSDAKYAKLAKYRIEQIGGK